MDKIKKWLNWWMDETVITARQMRRQGLPIRDTTRALALWSYIAALLTFLVCWPFIGRFKAAYWAGTVIAGSCLVWLMTIAAIVLTPLERAWERRKREKENPAQGPGA